MTFNLLFIAKPRRQWHFFSPMPCYLNFIIPGFRGRSDRGHGMTAKKSIGDHLRQPRSALLSPVLFPQHSTLTDFSNCLFVNAKSNQSLN